MNSRIQQILEVNYTIEVYRLNLLGLIRGKSLTGYGVEKIFEQGRKKSSLRPHSIWRLG